MFKFLFIFISLLLAAPPAFCTEKSYNMRIKAGILIPSDSDLKALHNSDTWWLIGVERVMEETEAVENTLNLEYFSQSDNIHNLGPVKDTCWGLIISNKRLYGGETQKTKTIWGSGLGIFYVKKERGRVLDSGTNIGYHLSLGLKLSKRSTLELKYNFLSAAGDSYNALYLTASYGF